MLIDTHCHLNFKAFKKDLKEVIGRAKAAAVEKIIIPGAKIDSSQRAVEIASSYPQAYAAVGIHPHHAAEFAHHEKEALLQLEKLAQNNKTVAIGEIGLDHYQYKNYPPIGEDLKAQQISLLKLQLNLAVEMKLPVILHCRQAHDVMLEFLENYLKEKTLNGVFHCFDGSLSHLEKILSLGFYVGFDGNCTYPENSRLVQAFSQIPLKRLLIETDAPFLTPIPQQGNRNEPAFLVHTAQFMASTLKIEVDAFNGRTSENATRLFNLSAK